MNQLSDAVLGRAHEPARPSSANGEVTTAEKADNAPIDFIDLKSQYSRIGSKVSAAIQNVVESGRYIMGPVIEELEQRLSDHADVGHSIGVSSGTEALFIPLLAKGIGAGDAVFMPAFTFTATAEVVVLAGATPVFVDVDRNSFNVSVADLKAKIDQVVAEGRLRPAAIVAVDLFGQPADYTAINALAASHDMLVIADAAQSFGAEAGNRRVGGLAQVTATSFYPSKPLGCYGDGGAIFTDDDELNETMRSVRNHGEGTNRYDIVRIGVNGRLDAMQAAVLLVKLDIFDDELERRETVARAYDERLGDCVEIPWRVPDTKSAWAQYTLKVEGRDELAAHLKSRGVPSMVYYPMPMHFQPAYAAYGAGVGSLPVSEALSGEVLSLPFHPYLSEGEIDRVSAAIAEFYGT